MEHKYITAGTLKTSLSSFLTNLLNYLPFNFNNDKVTFERNKVVMGESPVENEDAILIVGNGSDEKNAFEVLKDGSVMMNGDKLEHVEPISMDTINALN